jgi:5-formyltetrahydrofolate cyclo-ligase
MEERIQKINALYHKSQKEGLTPKEREQQATLRREYIENIKMGLRNSLENIDIVKEDGSIENVGKQRLRKEVLTLRDRMSPQMRERASVAVTDRILGHQWFYMAKKILCFVSFGSEIDTRGIIEEALRCGKEVYVPKVLSSESLAFYRLLEWDALVPGYHQIPEPKGDTTLYEYDPQEEDILLLMPGVAFDQQRRRIGYGKGCYDRFLANKETLQQHSIAIGFACQMVEHVEEGEWDIRPYQVITM